MKQDPNSQNFLRNICKISEISEISRFFYGHCQLSIDYRYTLSSWYGGNYWWCGAEGERGVLGCGWCCLCDVVEVVLGWLCVVLGWLWWCSGLVFVGCLVVSASPPVAASLRVVASPRVAL
jgi:hypothetical protein